MTMSKSMPVTGRNKPVVVIKLGGSMLEELADSFITSIKKLMKTRHVIFVHGGGPEINRMLEKLEVKSQFYNGQRKTTPEVLEVVQMVLAGKINKWLTARLQKNGIEAVGLSGCDGRLLTSSFLDEEHLGLVGKVSRVNRDFLLSLLELTYVPVIAPLGKTEDGQILNINADLCAAAVAENMNAEQLVFVTDVPGILQNGTLIEEADEQQIQELIDDGVIFGGMIPKVTSSLTVLSGQLKEVMIVNGKDAVFKQGTLIGTKIVKKKVVM
ncbi:N-acetylglutamate kinase [Melghiribacillus thermohalophilus]|uniref:Acetylglutamate kinase n=2 Tax=Melghiribacillus thermohalophilus TaxID=1324956 RepID=A0A4R3N2Y1_9BACI|nr:N-acetylglutamate kinase [Melghiribacillus thermohalophilus]